MTSVSGLIVALLIPMVLGYSWLNWIWRDAHLAAKIGYSYFLGIFFTTIVIYIYGSLGLSLDFWPIALILVGLSIFPVFFTIRDGAHQTTKINVTNAGWKKWLWWLLVLLLVIRFCGLAFEELWRPLYPWDAWMNWAPKAKTWFELKELVPYVHPDSWPMQSMQSGAYTLANPKASTYPPLVPLVQLWAALGIGEWRDNWVNLPWLFAGIALIMAVYGQLHLLHIHPVWSMLTIYLLFSTPYINTHIALAGYAELWLAAFYTLGFLSFSRWVISGQRFQLLLTILMMIACILTKKPGMLWASTLMLGILFNMLSVRWRLITLVSCALVVALWWIMGGIQFELSNGQNFTFTPDELKIDGAMHYAFWYHPVGEYFARNLLVLENWHLIGWLILLGTLPIFVICIAHKRLLPIAIPIIFSSISIGLIFFFTNHYAAAIDSTTLNRAVFHILPSMYLLAVIACWKRLGDTH